LDTKLANTYQVNGLDLSDRIISFDDLGGIWKLTEDVELTDEQSLKTFQTFGDYQIQIGDLIPKGSVLTFDITGLTEFEGKAEELKPKSDLFAYVFDVNKVR